MKVLKFGGTSVGSAQRMKDVARLINDGERKIVVLSAMSGTTNTLVEISDYLYKKNPEGANEIINRLEKKYKGHLAELFSTEEYRAKATAAVKACFDTLRSLTKGLFTEKIKQGFLDLNLYARSPELMDTNENGQEKPDDFYPPWYF